MADEIHVGNIGTMFKCTVLSNDVAENISAATTKKIIFLKSDATRVEKDASFYPDGTDGILTYTTVDGDLSVAGVWRIQGYVEIGSSVFYSNVQSFTVYGNI